MDLNEIAIFIKVIQKGSFTGAALALDMPKSTVSTKISNLERRLGVSLITRSTRKIRLTPAGEAFYLRSVKGFDELAAAQVAVRSETQEPQGRFRITAPVDVGNVILPTLCTLFLKKFPKVQMEILVSDRKMDFLEDEIDLAIRAGKLSDSSLIAKKVGEVSFKMYASPQYIKERGYPKTLKDISSHRCVLFVPLSTESWNLNNGKRSANVTFEEKIVVNNVTLAHNLALEGAGIALLPSFLCASRLNSEKLLPLLPEWSSEVGPLHLVYPAQKYVPPVIKAFIEMSSQILKERFQVLLQ